MIDITLLIYVNKLYLLQRDMDIVPWQSKRRIENNPGCLSLLWSHGIRDRQHGNINRSCEQACQTDQHRWKKSK